MDPKSIDELRQELRNLGYLSRGLERWFALDPWSSRTFWTELSLLAAKAAFLLSLFAAIPMVAVMAIRNRPLGPLEVVTLTVIDLAAIFVVVFAVIIVTALLLRLRPALALDSPRALTIVSMLLAVLLVGAVGLWWSGFTEAPSRPELAVMLALLFLLFAVSTIIFSAALLSFTIHEAQRLPRFHRQPRTVPISITGIALLLVLLASAWAHEEHHVAAPQQIVTAPESRRVAFVGVDGLSFELFNARPDLRAAFLYAVACPTEPGSSPEKWASIGTGTPAALHRVRAIEGVRLRGSARVLQAVSRFDPILLDVAPWIRLGERRPIPPSVRKRDYVWEVIASRGIPVEQVNWWATMDAKEGALTTVSQPAIFGRAARETKGDAAAMALAVDREALRASDQAVAGHASAISVYAPSLDIVLNRIDLDTTARLATSVRSLDQLVAAVKRFHENGYVVLLVGTPGEGASGSAVIASTIDLTRSHASLPDVAPTITDLLGFPASEEMSGSSLLPQSHQTRVASFGTREPRSHAERIDEEYYRSLRSLGYVR